MRPIDRTLAVSLALAALAGCAMNLSEGRPARILRPGQFQVSQANNIVVPIRVIPTVIDPGKVAIHAAETQQAPTDAQLREIGSAAVAVALMGPGYGTHVDLGYGLGAGFDISGRVGNGIYAASLRHSLFDGEAWQGNVGVRVGYNTGGSWIEYLDNANDFASVSEMRRLDLQAWGQFGREFGQWGRIWGGMKAMRSDYHLVVDAHSDALPRQDISDHLTFAGGFVGAAVGYRFVFFVMELNVFFAEGSVTAFDHRNLLSGPVIAPTWGFQGTWGGGI